MLFGWAYSDGSDFQTEEKYQEVRLRMYIKGL